MITTENIGDLLNQLTEEEIENIEQSDNDYVYLENHVFNIGSVVTATPMDYDEEVAIDASETGQVFMDKDTFFDWLEIFKNKKL